MGGARQKELGPASLTDQCAPVDWETLSEKRKMESDIKRHWMLTSGLNMSVYVYKHKSRSTHTHTHPFERLKQNDKLLNVALLLYLAQARWLQSKARENSRAQIRPRH